MPICFINKEMTVCWGRKDAYMLIRSMVQLIISQSSFPFFSDDCLWLCSMPLVVGQWVKQNRPLAAWHGYQVRPMFTICFFTILDHECNRFHALDSFHTLQSVGLVTLISSTLCLFSGLFVFSSYQSALPALSMQENLLFLVQIMLAKFRGQNTCLPSFIQRIATHPPRRRNCFCITGFILKCTIQRWLCC